MRSGNPVLDEEEFKKEAALKLEGERMTVSGTVNKTFVLFIGLMITATWAWMNPMQSPIILIGSIVLALVVGLITAFNKRYSPITAPIYALVEGVVLGSISVRMEENYPGIVGQAIGLTLAIFFALLIAYRSGLIRATENFKLMVVSATLGIMLLYLVNFALLLFFDTRVSMIHESGFAGIMFSTFVCILAALNLVLDFDFIEQGEKLGAPKYMEWYGAFGLMVTLIWLYMEILRLLAKSRRRK